MRDIPIARVGDFQDAFLERMRMGHAQDVLEPLSQGRITPEIEKIIQDEAASVALLFA
jgi:hypothetical protein